MINGKTNIYGLIGNPVSHTFSPIMHNKLFEHYKVNSLYCAFNVENDVLDTAILGLKSLNISGVNVTIPHKENIMRHLDHISEEAKSIGAVNTVKNVNGLLSGYNTDVYGFMKSLDENKIEYKNKRVAIMGFGGSAKAVVYGLVTSGIKTLDIYVRDEKKINELIKNMEIMRKISYNVINIKKKNFNLEDIDILVNTTPVGMGDLKDSSPIDLRLVKLKSDLAVVDLIYNPLETLLIKQANDLGLKSINGLDMLIYQGLKSFEIWTGKSPNKDIVLSNIVEYIVK